MRAATCILLAVALSLMTLSMPASAGQGASSRSSRSYSSAGTTHVRGYYRKDGTYVQPHERRAPGSSTPSQTYRAPRVPRTPRQYVPKSRLHETYRQDWNYDDLGRWSARAPSGSSGEFYGLHRDAHGRIERSEAAKHAFMRMHPCPSTGSTSGPCPGYVIDHIKALKHGGQDSPGNMQWQTVAEAKRKDKWE